MKLGVLACIANCLAIPSGINNPPSSPESINIGRFPDSSYNSPPQGGTITMTEQMTPLPDSPTSVTQGFSSPQIRDLVPPAPVHTRQPQPVQITLQITPRQLFSED